MSLILRIAAVLTLLVMAAVAGLQFSSYSWPRTVATVVQAGWEAELNLSHRGGSDYHVLYKFQVDGRTYENSLISFGTGGSVVHVINANEERQPREGDQVSAYYLSLYPGLSVLLPGPATNLWIWGVVAVLVAIMFWMVGRVMHEPVI